MKTLNKTVYGPDMLKFSAEYAQAENPSEYAEVIAKLGLSLDDVNEALRVAKKRVYEAALESTPESRIDAMVTKMRETGAFEESEIQVIAESARAKAKNSLPSGLTPVLGEDGKQVVGKPRGRAAATKTEEKPVAA